MKCILTYEEVDFSRPYASPCCHIMPQDENLHIEKITSLNDLLHTNLYSDLRKNMSQGNKDPLCKVCWNDEENLVMSDRVLENHIRKKRDTVELRSLKIALDYTCNMMCRICTPTCSSKWSSSKLAKTSLSNFDEYSFEYDKYDIVKIVENSDLSKLERIKILGGEPFYSKKLDWFIDYLQENTDFKNLRMYFTTNASVFPSEKLLQKLLQCDNLYIELSLDAIGDLTKLCRWGVDWEPIHENIQKWLALDRKKVKISAHCTMSVYNANKMQELVDYCKKYKIFLHVNKLRSPVHLSVDMIDIDTRKSWLLPGDTPTEKLVNQRLQQVEPIPLKAKNKFLIFNKVLDEYQKESLNELNKEIYDYFYNKPVLSKTFCYSPFNQVYIGRNQEVKPCCAAIESFGHYDKSIKEVVNNKTAQDARQSFLFGQFPKDICKGCSNYFKDTGTLHDVQKNNNLIALEHYGLSKQVLQKDLQTQKPVFLDLLVSNKCNFACLGCESSLSSTWANNYTDIEYERDKDVKPVNISPEWQNDINPVIDYILEHKDTIKLLHLNGGEPFMQEGFYKLFDALIEHKLFDIEIVSHTNGSVNTYKGKDIIDEYLSKFNFSIIMSHDHYGDRGYYMRYPLNETKWLDNYKRLQKVAHISVQTSYNVFNALTLDKLEQWYIDNGVDLSNWVLSPWHGPKCYTTRILTEQHREQAHKVLDSLTHKRDLHSLLNISDKDPLLLRNFKTTIDMFDKKRNTNFAVTFPELAEYLND